MKVSDETMILELSSPKRRQAEEDYIKEFCEAGQDLNGGTTYSGESYTFYYVREEDDRILGMLNLRPGDPDCGNLGYSIRPTEQGKGYGKMLLEQALELCSTFGITNPKAVVLENNLKSRRVLEGNGFTQISKRRESDGQMVLAYARAGATVAKEDKGDD